MTTRSQSRTYGFIMVSVMTHVSLASGLFIYKIQNESKKDPIAEFEVVTGPTSEVAPSPAASVSQEKEVLKPSLAKISNRSVPTRPALPKASPPVITPIVAAEISELKDADISDAFATVDQEQATKVEEAHQEMAEEADRQLQEQEQSLNAIQKQNEDESEKMAREQKARRDLEDLEKTALAAAAAERLAREAQAQREAEESRRAEALNTSSQKTGSTSNVSASDGPGDKGAVRALSELKQMPGNKRPLYDVDDRRRGLHGEVAFMAYVSKEGSLTQFSMIQSSGHRELDSKTLKAIKGWKFYPGQEGWVEIPFKWDLNGEPQEMPATLRRRAQVSQNPMGPG